MARLNARWDDFTNRGQIWDHFWQDISSVATYIQASQSQVDIQQTYICYAQSQSQIILENYASGNSIAQILTTYTQYAQTQVQIESIEDLNPVGQAAVCIQIPLVTLFYDSFSRTTSAPPFALGIADTGQEWQWSDYSSAWTEATSPIYVDGSNLVLPNSTYESIHGGISIDQGEVLIDFWIPAAGDYNAWWYWFDTNWYAAWWVYDDTNYTIYGNNTYIQVSVTRSAWHRLRIVVDSLSPTNEYVKAHLWKIGDTEPETWVTVQTSWPVVYGEHIAPIFEFQTPTNEPALVDNIIITSTKYTIYNQSAGQGLVKLNSFDYPQFGQAQTILNQAFQAGQALATIIAVAWWTPDVHTTNELIVFDETHIGPQDISSFPSYNDDSGTFYRGWLRLTFPAEASDVVLDNNPAWAYCVIFTGNDPDNLTQYFSEDDGGYYFWGTYYVQIMVHEGDLAYLNIVSPSFPLIIPTYVQGSASFSIDSNIWNNFAYANANISSYDVNNFAQAQAWIGSLQYAQALVGIKQTYPFTPKDIALFKPVTVSSTYAGAPENVTDGDDETYNHTWAPVPGNWIRIDLETPQQVSAYRLYQPLDIYWRATTVYLEYSDDDLSWSQASVGWWLGTDNFIYIFPITARYWRIYAAAGGVWESPAGWQVNTISLYDYDYNVDTYAQTQVAIRAPAYGQTQVYISPAFDQSQFGQAFAEILPPPNIYVSANAQAQLIAFNVPQWAQTQAQIGHQVYAQSQARMLAFNVPVFGQTLVYIGHFQSSNAQGQLRSFDQNIYGQAQALLWHPAGYANTQVWITVIYSVFGQAQCWYLPSAEKGYAQADIKQTYPLMSMDINYALVVNGASVTDSVGQITPINVIDGDDLGPLWEIVGVQTNPPWIQIDLGQNRTINYYRILPFKYDCTVSLQYRDDSNVWHDVISGIQFNVGIFDPIDTSRAVTGEIVPILARVWRLLVTDPGSYGGISVLSFELGWATVKSGTFAQAQAFFSHIKTVQAMAYVSPAMGWRYSQIQADIVNTYQTFGLSRTWVIPPTVIGLTNVDIQQTYFKYGLGISYIIPPTVIAQTQAKIITFDNPVIGQVKVDIQQTYLKFGYTKVFIYKHQGFGQALVAIRDRVHGRGYGQSRVSIGHWGYASVQTYIIKSWNFAQAKAGIRKVDIEKTAQAMTFIRIYPSANVQADIMQTYMYVGYSIGALLNTGLETASVQADIVSTYFPVAYSQSDIKQVYIPISQAQVIIHEKHYPHAQAIVTISKQWMVTGQTTVWIGYHKFSQTQAQIAAFNVPKFGLAVGYILAGQVVPGPSSDYQTYLVRFNGHDLPGYAQSESYVNDEDIIQYVGPYIDGSKSEEMGLKNIVITIEMLVWERTYQACKDKVRLAATFMRTAKGFAPLYIQRYDRYYLALARSLKVSKAVPESPRILKYTVEWEARPWISESPTPPPVIIPPIIPPIPTAIYREVLGLSQAKIKSFGAYRTGISQARITLAKGFGLSQAFITKTAEFGQARSSIINSYKFYGQARTSITRTVKNGQARVVIITLPGAPYNLVATPGDTVVTLSWSPPPYN